MVIVTKIKLKLIVLIII